MRELLPAPTDPVDAADRYVDDHRITPPNRPWVLLNMVTSIDGATATSGVSGALSGPGDRSIFHALRSVADVILVGAGTVRAERYGPPRTSEHDQERRIARGQQRFPRIAVVSGRLELDPTAALFAESPTVPFVITATGDPEREATLRPVAEVLHAGSPQLDMTDALTQLRTHGASVVLAEGGPTLNGQLLLADLVDEICLTIAPSVASGSSARFATGPPLDPPQPFTIDRVLEENGFLFLRYLRGQ